MSGRTSSGASAAEADRAGCTTFAAEGEADSVAGAYVFRHGLAEALGLPEATPVCQCRVVLKSGALTIEAEKAP